MAAAAIMVLGAGCSSDEPSFRELMEGVAVDPADYELSEISCVKEANQVTLTADLTNLTSEPQDYAVRYEFTKSDGATTGITHEGDFAGPGQTIDISTRTGNPDDYDDPPQCSVAIFRSALTE